MGKAVKKFKCVYRFISVNALLEEKVLEPQKVRSALRIWNP